MATNDFGFLGRKKTKTKEYSDNGKMVTKTKVVSTPKEGGVTKNVTKTTTRPTFVEGAKRILDLQPVGKKTTRNVSYNQTKSTSPEQKLREERAKKSANTTSQLKTTYRPDTPLANTPEPKKYK
jgi:hypothetical protein